MRLGFVLALFVSLASALCRDGGTVLYAVDGASGFRPSKLYILSADDGSLLETVGAIGTGYNHTVGIESSPLDKQLYATDNTDGNNAALLELDARTGHATLVGYTGAQLPDLAFSPEGILYSWREFPAPTDVLVRVNVDTAHLTQIGGEEISTSRTGIALDLDNRIWLKSADDLYRLNSDGTVAEMIVLSQTTSNVLAFDSDGTLYTGTRSPPGGADENTTFTLQTIDMQSGAVTDVGPAIPLPIAGIAFACDDGMDNLPLILVIVLLSSACVLIVAVTIIRIIYERTRPTPGIAYASLAERRTVADE